MSIENPTALEVIKEPTDTEEVLELRQKLKRAHAILNQQEKIEKDFNYDEWLTIINGLYEKAKVLAQEHNEKLSQMDSLKTEQERNVLMERTEHIAHIHILINNLKEEKEGMETTMKKIQEEFDELGFDDGLEE